MRIFLITHWNNPKNILLEIYASFFLSPCDIPYILLMCLLYFIILLLKCMIHEDSDHGFFIIKCLP